MDKTNLQVFNPAGDLMITHLFLDRITSVKIHKGKNEHVFKKMREIQSLEEKVKTFIRLRPGSIVTIGVIEEDHRDPKRLDYSVTVKNFREFTDKGLQTVDSEDPERYLLIINQTWNDYITYQYSPDGILIKE